MKTIFISLLLVCQNLRAQEGTTVSLPDTTSTSTSYDWHSENAINGVVSISKKQNAPQVIINRTELENEIVRIDGNIAMINAKIATVNSNPQEFQIATDSGWFDDMQRIIDEYTTRKLEIQTILLNN